MAVKIRLQRLGKRDYPFYRIVAAEEGVKRNGKTIVQLGTYNPKSEPPLLNIDKKKLDLWLKNGAQLTDATRKLLAANT